MNSSSLGLSSRRGILLLLILALLSLFGLMAVAFVVLTSQAQRSARSIERIDLVSDPPDKLLHQAAMQVFRGANTSASVLAPHSLLEDIYGNNSAAGTIFVEDNSVCGGQLIEFSINPTPTGPTARTGCVLTVTGPSNSPFVGQSSMIVGYSPRNAAHAQMSAFDGPRKPAQGEQMQVVISGAPFSGMGFGGGSGADVLRPNAAANRASTLSANEDYDAPDCQNMLLAAQIPKPDGGVDTVLPSLHRPDLLRSSPGWQSNPSLLHDIMLRPIGRDIAGFTGEPDHPDFNGGNPAFDPAWDGATPGHQWDVDNDGDGAADSVWVDLGLPVRSTSDGRLYKPLFAILCVDLDGRLNVNAHGCEAQAYPYDMMSDLAAIPFAGNAGSPVSDLPRGLGYGPAEINLWPILNKSGMSDNDRLDLYRRVLDYRYPNGNLAGDSPDYRLNWNTWFLYGGDYWSNAFAKAGAYGSPLDLWGTAAIGLDSIGRPFYVDMGQALDVNTQCPYQYNLSAKRLRGSVNGSEGRGPFSAAELERLLRPFDRDATRLPDRLARATSPGPDHRPEGSVLLALRHSVTTDTWDMPVPPVAGVLPGGAAKHIVDVLRGLLMKKAASNAPATMLSDAELDAMLPQLFAPELLAGRKMNLDRAFGNGRDDGNGIVDGPGNTSERVALYNSAIGSDKPPLFNISYDSTDTATDSLQARQIYARYLFVLADLLTDRNALQRAMNVNNHDDVARFLAQWAVNVVDFCDADSIMTPFDYDVDYMSNNPTRHATAGWQPRTDGSCRVWGCERPELLITETLAFHDRRTEDLDTEMVDTAEWGNTDRTGPGKTTDEEDDKKDKDKQDPNAKRTKDTTFDQRYRPQGSLFIELYNPWTGNREPSPAELYDNGRAGVDLGRTVGGSPVWRLIITPRYPYESDASNPYSQPKIERAVYFVSQAAVPTSALPVDPSLGNEQRDAKVKYQPDANAPPIMPGRYAVIGPGGTTYLGFQDGDTPNDASPNTRRIVLTAGAASPVDVYNNGSTRDPVSSVAPASITINQPGRFCISEPDGGYPEKGPVNKDGVAIPYNEDDGYAPPYDVPLDNDCKDESLRFAIQNNQRTDSVKLIRLQRLANPLFPYNPVANPYRTIDAMPVDLTAFNGLTKIQETIPQLAPNPMPDPPPEPTPPQNMAEMTPGLGAEPAVPAFYAHQRGQNNGSNSTPGGCILWKPDSIESTPAANTNGYIPNDATEAFNLPSALHHSLGFLNNPFSDNKGNQKSPFPWLTWNNRPLVSQLELFLVPCAKSGSICESFPNDLSGGGSPYDQWGLPFPHLLSFLHSYPSNPAQLYRILDFVHVPSRYVGTEVQVDPSSASSGDHMFHPPFNRIPTYREPGKINLNTIFSQEVYDGLMNGCPGPTYALFDASRRPGGACMFSRPFRSWAGASLMPSGASSREIDATLLRSQGTQPLFSFASSHPCNDTARNPFFYYQGLQRLANLTTTRSNVYAVWITVGYFEVTPHPQGVDAAHPDGFRLGRELGLDTGEIERHRAFYIFDRSLPVGFQRGQDLNVEKAIVVRRYIE